MKPILRVIFTRAFCRMHKSSILKNIMDNIKKKFDGNYEVIAVPENVEIIPENTIIVNLTIQGDTNIEELVKQLSRTEELNRIQEGLNNGDKCTNSSDEIDTENSV